MEVISSWISAMRLRTLPLSISGIILASCFAQYKGFFEWHIFILSILTTLSFQILSNFANDYGDGVKGTDNDDRIGPERAIQSGKITPKQLMYAIKVNIAISFILAVALIFFAFGGKYLLLSIIFVSLGIGSIIAAIRYTMGHNAYGYRGLGDFYVFFFFGLVSVMGCYTLYAKQIDYITILPSIAIGLLSAAVLNLNNMRDRLSDEKSNKITLAVKLGAKKVKIYHNFLILAAVLSATVYSLWYYDSLYNLIFMSTYTVLFLHLKKVNSTSNPKMLDPELKKIALTTVALAILMGLGRLLPL